MQGGALVPTGFDNKGLRGYGTLAIIDSVDQSLHWRELPGPRFCTAYEQLEEEKLIAEAKQLGHQLFLRRYFDGARPEQPAGVEAYEPLPIALRNKAQLVLGVDSLPTAGRLEALVTEWLDEMRAVHGEEAALHEKLLRRYL